MMPDALTFGVILIADWYYLAIIVCLTYLTWLSTRDVESRYADPKSWKWIWLFIIPPSACIWVALGVTEGPVMLVFNAFWMVVAYLCAKLPGLQIMGGQDARVLLSAGWLFPQFGLAVPFVFCAGLVVSGIVKRFASEEKRADWDARGRPMVPYFLAGWIVCLLVLLLYVYFG